MVRRLIASKIDLLMEEVVCFYDRSSPRLEFRMRMSCFIPVVLSLTFVTTSLPCQDSKISGLQSPTISSAVDGIFAAFQTHPIVALGDFHGLAQEEDFYVALVSDTRFASDVGNVVVEFGDAAQQETIDRYVAGDDVPYEQLRRVWSDTVGWIPTVTGLGYINFYAQIREINRTLAPTKRIHVWLGDPPVNWATVKTSDEVQAIPRNQTPAEILTSKVLSQKKKALLIYGYFHFYGDGSIKELVEKEYPASFFIITPYTGFVAKTCSEAFENSLKKWPIPALAAPVRGTTLQGLVEAPNCHYIGPNSYFFPPQYTDAMKTRKIAEWEARSSGVAGDALLYLGPAADLMGSPMAPDIYMDQAFRKEINRRTMLQNGHSLVWPTVQDNPVLQRHIHPYANQGNHP